jgi:hypothetical protein
MRDKRATVDTIVNLYRAETGEYTLKRKFSASPDIRAQFVHSRGQNVGMRVEMKLLSTLQSEEKLVDVTGFEPATPCLQSRCSPS